MAHLEVQGITKRFEGLTALGGVDFEVEQGEVLGLIGPNGAGKTTLFNIVCGFLKPTNGQIIFKGSDITGLPPHILAKKGIVRTFQTAIPFEECTVLENVLLGYHLHSQMGPRGFWSTLFGTSFVRQSESQIIEKALATLQFVGMEDRKDQLAKHLSHGHKKALSLAIALGADPEIMLLDEPMSAVNREEVAVLSNLLRLISSRGTTIILVEHNVGAVFGLCGRVVVISSGKKIAQGTPAEVSSNEEVIRAYLGVRKHVTAN